MTMRGRFAASAAVLGLAVALGAGGSAGAASLVHAYEFNNAGGASAIDLVAGGVNGTLVGGASIAGGVLSLDGASGEVTFGAKLIPTGGDFSVFVRAQILQPVSAHTEIIAQGSSGAPGFYIGSGGNQYRLSDAYGSPGLTFHVDDAFHNLLLTNGAGALQFSIDGTQVFSGAQVNFGGACDTRIGNQFCGVYNEFFKGSIDTVRIFSGVATYDEASGPDAGAGVPEPASWALMIAGFGLAGAALRRRRSVVAA